MTPLVWLPVLVLAIAGCSGEQKKSSGNEPAIEEIAQQIGDNMAAIDEAGGNSGSITWQPSSHDFEKSFARLAPGELTPSSSTLLPSAAAASCSAASTFGSCSGGQTVTRNFAGCTVGVATYAGTVTFTWSPGNSCTLSTTGNSISRSPNFTVSGRRGATLNVTRSGTIGQRLTWLSGSGGSKSFSFQNDGIRRVFTSGGTTLFDYTTTTTTNMTVTGSIRTGRTLTGGNLRITNNVSAVTCNYVPSSVTWNSSCNCATSGTWSGACSDGKSTTLTLTGCGTGTLLVGGDTTTVDFDRCGS